MSKIFIYALSNPETKEICYIGKTNNIDVRYKQHCYGNTKNLNLSNWIKNLQSRNLAPQITVIEECSDINWEEREKHWISYYGLANLLNIQDGGKSFLHSFSFKRSKTGSTHKSKIKSIEHYMRWRGFRKPTDASKHSNKTPNGKMNAEYWELLTIDGEFEAIKKLLERREGLRNFKKQ